MRLPMHLNWRSLKIVFLSLGKAEMYQEVEGTMIPFNDRKIAKELIEKRFGFDQ